MCIYLLKGVNKIINLSVWSEPGEMFKVITDFTIPGIETNRYYCSNFGRIYDSQYHVFRITGKYNEYNYFHYKGKNYPVHRIVKSLFSNSPFHFTWMDVNHKDGIKSNNHESNLEWSTRKENIQHAYDTGLHPVGVENKLSKIKDEAVVVQICKLLQSGKYYNKDIATMVGNGVTEHMVADIKKRQCWTHISKNYTFNQRVGKKFDNDLIENVCKYFEDHKKPDSITVNDHCKNALIYLNVNYDSNIIDCLRKVYTRKYYTHISSKYNF